MQLNKAMEVYLYLLENGYHPDLTKVNDFFRISFKKQDLYKLYTINLSFTETHIATIYYNEDIQYKNTYEARSFRQLHWTRTKKSKEDFRWDQYLFVIKSLEIEDFLIDLVLRHQD